jgi:hypothetical protein
MSFVEVTEVVEMAAIVDVAGLRCFLNLLKVRDRDPCERR